MDTEGVSITEGEIGDIVTLQLTMVDWFEDPVTDWDTSNIYLFVATGSGAHEAFPADENTGDHLVLPWSNNGDGTYEFTLGIPGAGAFNLRFAYLFAMLGQYIEIGSAALSVTPGPVEQFFVVTSTGSTMPNFDVQLTIYAATAGDPSDPDPANHPSAVSFGPHVLPSPYEVIVTIDGNDEGVGLGNVFLNFVEGVAQHTIRFPAVGDGQVITVTSVADGAIVGSSNPINVAIGQAFGETSTIEAPSVQVAVGEVAMFTVRLRDQAGNPVGDTPGSISFYLNDAHLDPEGTALSAGGGEGGNLQEVSVGVYEFAYVHNTPGPYTISAFIGANHGEWAGLGAPIGVASSVAESGILASFRVRQLGNEASEVDDQFAGTPFTVEIEALDASGARLASGPNVLNGAFDLNIATTSGSPGTGLGDEIGVTFAAGLATRQVTLTALQAAEALHVASSATPPLNGTSDTFVVHPGTLAAFAFEFLDGSPFEDVTPRTAGVLHPLQLRALDAAGNTLASGPNLFTGTVTLSSNAAGIAPVGLGQTPPFTAGVLTLDSGAPDRRIALTQVRPDARFTVTQVGGAMIAANSANFAVISDDIVSAAQSLIEAQESVLVDATATVTVTLRDQFQNVIVTPNDVTLAFSDFDDELVTADAQGAGIFTYEFTRAEVTTVTVRAYLGEDDQGLLLGQLAVDFTAEPPPPPPPPPPPVPATQNGPGPSPVIEATGQVFVPLATLRDSGVRASGTTTVQVAPNGGSTGVRVSFPSAALGPLEPCECACELELQDLASGMAHLEDEPCPFTQGIRLEVGFVEEMDFVGQQAPTPEAGKVVAQFTARLIDLDGHTVSRSFAAPVVIEFETPLSSFEGDLHSDSLVLVYWNGASWVEVPATVHVEGETVTIRAEVLHFTLFSIMQVDAGWGTFKTTMKLGPLAFGRWLGGTYSRMDVAAVSRTIWAHSNGTWVAYNPAAPAIVNARFKSHFPEGLGAGHPVVIRSRSGQ